MHFWVAFCYPIFLEIFGLSIVVRPQSRMARI
jgi:hypothetical protein